MYLKLKENEKFIDSETGQEFTNLVAGIKNINITIDEKRCTFLLKMFLSRELMLDGKNHVFQQSFTIEDTDEKTDFTKMYTTKPSQIYFGLDMELLMYNFILSQEGFEMFEKEN